MLLRKKKGKILGARCGVGGGEQEKKPGHQMAKL